MASLNSVRAAVVLAVINWRLWVIQFLGNVVLFLAFVWWTQPWEANWGQIVFSSLLLLVTAAAALVLHGGTLDFFHLAHQSNEARLKPAFRSALRHVPAMALWAVIFVLVQLLVWKLDQYSISLPGYLRSEFPAWLRRIISEPALDNIYSGIIWLLRWVIVPGLLLPFALFCAEKGFRGLAAIRDWGTALKSLSYWIVLVVAAVLAVFSIQGLMSLKPDPKTSTVLGDQISLFFRLLFAYLLGIFCWLLACSMLGRRTAHPAREAGAQPV